MKNYIGYIRVSTVKQGVKGVSLQEQRDAISRYADRNHFTITIWLEESETAAKRGRPVFNQMLKLLRAGKAAGVILHKLDRGARNLKDWADIAELSDQGVEIHFANESLDLHSRGGRLSADIQAVVAADYIRNLREETRKGFYGRLKQGLYPLGAPLGYLDTGKGNPKTIAPAIGPLVRRTFELYDSSNHSLETLGDEMYRLGLRNRNNGRVTKTGLSTILNNPFYIGLIRIRKTAETFPGIHQPLISKSLFDRVKSKLAGKSGRRHQRHHFSFSRLIKCASCDFSLIGERQKGHVYYRCHTKSCPKTTIREELVDAALNALFSGLEFSSEEMDYFSKRILILRTTWAADHKSEVEGLTLNLSQVKARLIRMTDAYIDRVIEKSDFETRKADLLLEQKTIEERLSVLIQKGCSGPDVLLKFLELVKSLPLSYSLAFPEEKRELVKIITSNRVVDGQNLVIEPSIPFGEIINRSENHCCGLQRNKPRTLDKLVRKLIKLSAQNKLPDLSSLAPSQSNVITKEVPRKNGKFAKLGNN